MNAHWKNWLIYLVGAALLVLFFGLFHETIPWEAM